MTNLKSWVLVGALALAAVLPSTALAQEVCKVTDPTGTPLNFRKTPNGKILGQIKNGTKVHIEDYAEADNGKLWVYVVNARTNQDYGWVIREFVSCYQDK